MKVVFVYPDIERFGGDTPDAPRWTGEEHYGISCLSASLKTAGHKTSLMHITKPVKKSEYVQLLSTKLAGEERALIGFSVSANLFPFVEEWSKWTKEEFDVPIICGGIHPTLSPEEAISPESIDAICIGEGEKAIIELCNKMDNDEDITNILNIWSRQNGVIYKNPVRPLIQNLDSLPFPDKNIFNYPILTSMREYKVAQFMASRGCPYDCSYCCNHAVKKIYQGCGKYVRFKSVDYIITEIKGAIENYPFIERIFFDDDILPLKKDWFREFANKYKNEIGLPFSCNFRPNLTNQEVVRLLREAGCERVHIGIESGNQFIRNNVLNRQIEERQIIDTCSLFKKAGIHVFSYNMVGLPFEDTKAILDTVKLNAKAKVDSAWATIFYPFKGTAIYDVCQKENLISKKVVTSFFTDTKLSSSLIAGQQVRQFRRLFNFLVKIYTLIDKTPNTVNKLTTKSLDRILDNRHLLSMTDLVYRIIKRFLKRFGWLDKLIKKLATNVSK